MTESEKPPPKMSGQSAMTMMKTSRLRAPRPLSFRSRLIG